MQYLHKFMRPERQYTFEYDTSKFRNPVNVASLYD